MRQHDAECADRSFTAPQLDPAAAGCHGPFRDSETEAAADPRLTYQLGPGTALYVGYTTGFQSVTPSLGGLPVNRISTPITQVGRQVFAKISYLIRR